MVTEERTIELTLSSATDLKKVKKFGREQKCYAVAYIYPAQRHTTLADPYGGVNPTWNASLNLTCFEAHLQSPAEGASSSSARMLTVDIYCHSRGLLHYGDKLVGSVTVPLVELGAAPKAEGLVGAFDVRRQSGKTRGILNLSVKLGAKRPLGEFEDPSVAKLSSYSSHQVGSSYGRHKSPMKSMALDSKSGPETSADMFGTEEIVTGYPVSGYAFAPLGQMPVDNRQQLSGSPWGQVPSMESGMRSQQQYGHENPSHGPYGSYGTPARVRHHKRHQRHHKRHQQCPTANANGRCQCRKGRKGKRVLRAGMVLLGGVVLGLILL